MGGALVQSHPCHAPVGGMHYITHQLVCSGQERLTVYVCACVCMYAHPPLSTPPHLLTCMYKSMQFCVLYCLLYSITRTKD